MDVSTYLEEPGHSAQLHAPPLSPQGCFLGLSDRVLDSIENVHRDDNFEYVVIQQLAYFPSRIFRISIQQWCSDGHLRDVGESRLVRVFW
jgi:hypothetical protein